MAKKSLKKELTASLMPRLARERSTHADKQRDHAEYERLKEAGLPTNKMDSLTKRYFYSESTLREYAKRGALAWAYINKCEGHRVPLSEVPSKLSLYLDERKRQAIAGQISPRTLAKERAQLSKVFNVNLDGYKILPCTSESDKGRGKDAHWNPQNHRDAIEFWTMCGARKAEYHNLNKGEIAHYEKQFRACLKEHKLKERPLYRDMHGRVPNIQPIRDRSGQVGAVIICHAKHGKTNYSVIHPDDRERLTEIFDSGDYQRYFYPSDHANIHACRRAYAQKLYEAKARPIERLDEKQLYRTRDGTQRVYDREAVAFVAENLGHTKGDLYDTIHNYLR